MVEIAEESWGVDGEKLGVVDSFGYLGDMLNTKIGAVQW